MNRPLLRALLLTPGLALVLSPPAVAQHFGQWSWSAALAAGQGRFETELGQEKVDTSTQEDLWLSFGMTGYVVHPAIASFEISTDLRLSESTGSTLTGSDDLGVRADFALLPRGSYPSLFFFERRLFDFTLAEEDGGPFLLRGLPDTVTRWGGRTAFARGPLVGLTAGFQFATVAFLDPESGHEEKNNQFLDWSRNGRRVKHNVRLEHHEQRFSALRSSFDDLILGVVEHGDLSEDWDWRLSGSGYHRSVASPNRGAATTDTYRVDNTFSREVSGGDRLALRQSFGYFSSTSDSVTDAGVLATYDWRANLSLTVSPFGSYTHQSADSGMSVSEPRLGVGLSWIRQVRRLRATVTTRVSYGQRERTEAALSEEEQDLAYAWTLNLTHSGKGGFREEVEAEALHNELRRLTEPLADLPDLGLRRSLGAEDSYRLRLSAGKKWRRYGVNSFGQWQRRESVSDRDVGSVFDSETVSANVGFSGPATSLTANVGMTEVFQEPTGIQEIEFQSLSLRVQPWRFLSLSGMWRSDTRQLPLLPDFDGERLEVEVELRIGEIFLSGRLFEVRRIELDGSERVDRGLGWSISRGVAGWLPIRSAVERRGTIR